jgi:hypothetical protein
MAPTNQPPRPPTPTSAIRETPSRAYGRTLLRLSEPGRIGTAPGALGVVEHPREPHHRIRTIAGFRPRTPRPVVAVALALALALGLFFLTDAATPQSAVSASAPETSQTAPTSVSTPEATRAPSVTDTERAYQQLMQNLARLSGCPFCFSESAEVGAGPGRRSRFPVG